MSKSYQNLADELGRTAVLSESFKGHLLALVQNALSEVHEAGVEEGRRRERASTLPAPNVKPSIKHHFSEEYAPGWFRCVCGVEANRRMAEVLKDAACPGPQEKPE